LIDIERFLAILEEEVKRYRVPVVDLIGVQTSDPFRVLIATILSARTKDEVTAVAAGQLFDRAADATQLAALSRDEIAQLIYPVGFYKTKAAHLQRCGRLLLEQFGGMVPATLEELITLPGVGRKTANLVLSVAFDIPAICVDTHVHRIMNIWGYVKTKNPLETEMALRKTLPLQYWKKVNSLLVAFGQGLCKPVSPHCDRCVISEDCPQIGVTPRKC
jgi:endonuclease III